MLKRIAVLGNLSDQPAAFPHTEGGTGIEFVEVGEDGDLPLGTVALFASGRADAAGSLAEELGRQHEVLYQLLADAVDAREGLLPGSAERLRQHAERFARALQLSADEQLTLERGALLHDIGKIRIANDVLLKKSVLTYDEWILLQQHTTLGADLLLDLNFATDTADILRSHHECWDGDGYPQHLERNDIPLLARVVKIIDVYCAMTSPRTYRKSFSTHEQAVDHLRSERGKHFDPGLLDTFLDGGVARPLEYMPAE